jgi:hypothetical protein
MGGRDRGQEQTADDILEAVAASHQALEPFVARDWSVQARRPRLERPENRRTRLDAAAATLAAVARAAPPGARAYHNHSMADTTGFIAMGCDEILVHGWDAVRGFGADFAPPAELAERVLRRLFPWAPTNESPWLALLWANGRADLPSRVRTGPDWSWHCAPLDEWDGTVPRQDTLPVALRGTTTPAGGGHPSRGW